MRILYISDQRYYHCHGEWFTSNGFPLADCVTRLGEGMVDEWTFFGRLEDRKPVPVGAVRIQPIDKVATNFVGPMRQRRGMLGYLMNAWTYLRILRDAMSRHNVLLVKANFVAAWFCIPFLLGRGARVAISHQIGDPAGVAVGPKALLPVIRVVGAVLTAYVHRLCEVNVFVSSDLAKKYGCGKLATWILNESQVRKEDIKQRDTLTPSVHKPLRIIYVGRLAKEKCVDVLLVAASQLHVEWRLSIVGDGALRVKLAQIASDLGIERNVRFTGAVEWGAGLFDLLREHDVLVLPSSTEGLGLVLIEAMSQGVLVIGTQVGGIPDLIEHERTGLLVAPGNAEEIAAALMRYVASPELRLRVRQQALRTAERNTFEEQLGEMFSRIGRLAEDRGL